MKPSELYETQVSKTDVSNNALGLKGAYYNHVPEADIEYAWKDLISDKLEIRTIKFHCFDGRRYWHLATVWFEGKPVMVIQNAGREGDDHSKRFITDWNQYLDMCKHIKMMAVEDEEVEKSEDVVDADEEIKDLDNFYSYNLKSHFDFW